MYWQFKRKTFILGVGAQKSGTTWLHSYLSRSNRVATGPMKEYHVWDACYVDQCRRWMVEVEPSSKTGYRHLRWRLQQNNSEYFDYFAGKLSIFRKNIGVDITPSYSALPVDVLSQIKNGFAKRGIRTKAVFLMRDPVERCWSAARYQRKRFDDVEKLSAEDILEYALSTESVIRTRYDKTLENLSRTFDRNDVYVGFFENMFEQQHVHAVSDFCGVATQLDYTDKTRNATPKKRDLEGDARIQIAQTFRPVYEYVASRYPEAVNLWPGFKLL